MRIKKIKIVHPEFGESEILSESLHVWEKRGWSVPSAKVVAPVAVPTAAPIVANKGIVGSKKTKTQSEVS